MNLELLVNLHNCLTTFDPNTPIAVICHKGRLQYRQLSKIVDVSGIEGLYFSSRDINLGILTPSDFNELMSNLRILIQDPLLKDHLLETNIKEYGFDVYKVYRSAHLHGPQLYLKFKLVTFKSRFISSIILRNFSPATRTLLKALKDEFRTNRSKGNKQE